MFALRNQFKIYEWMEVRRMKDIFTYYKQLNKLYKASRGGADMICKYRDAENGMCSLHSDLSYPLLEYCVEGPCPDEVLICNDKIV